MDHPEYDKKWWIAKAMTVYGGSFTQLLGQLWFKADLFNQARIEKTWPHLFEDYEEKARCLKKRTYEEEGREFEEWPGQSKIEHHD